MYLFRGITNFYLCAYEDAINDFENVRETPPNSTHTNTIEEVNPNQLGSLSNGKPPRLMNNNENNEKNETEDNDSINDRASGVNEFTSIESNQTDLSEVGLTSLNVYEKECNILICYLLLNKETQCKQVLNKMWGNKRIKTKHLKHL